jgi:hypothetical protein
MTDLGDPDSGELSLAALRWHGLTPIHERNTSMATAKQAAADIRKTLGMLANSGHIRFSSGTEIKVPAGLGFSVRATRTGVNITIEDRGWVDNVTGGDREEIDGHGQEQKEIKAEVDKIRGMYKPELPGETKWGTIIISARATTTSREGSRISDSDHYDPRLYCDRCRVEILRGEDRHEIAGRTSGRIDTLCGTCHAKWMTQMLTEETP